MEERPLFQAPPQEYKGQAAAQWHVTPTTQMGEGLDTQFLKNDEINCPGEFVASTIDYEVGLWNSAPTTGTKASGVEVLTNLKTFLEGDCQKSTLFGYFDGAAVGVYVGADLANAHNIEVAVGNAISQLQNGTASFVWQYGGSTKSDTIGVTVNLDGDLAILQNHVVTWSDGGCITGFETNSISNAVIQKKSSVRTSTSLTKNDTVLARSFSHIKSLVSGDSCASLVTECGITAAELTEYNTASDLCSTLTLGQYICCSAGTLPDLAPSMYSNGTCYTYNVQSGDTCSAIAEDYTITVDDIDTYNSDTWGWYGCDDLQEGQNICLSNGTSPYPVALANAVCGPQVPGTNFTGTDGPDDWAALNSCPLNACCDVWGQCGTTPEYCNDTLASTGAPGTAAEGSEGCISNCGTAITNDAVAPSSYSAIGYYEVSSMSRPCLQMNAFSIDVTKYTHVHFAFGNITSNFSLSVEGAVEQFGYFQKLEDVKRIISFGGWAFSTDADTYMIFREGVTEANRDTLITNVVDFISNNDLDGVDFDWEYPGEPDIPGIPAGSSDDGDNYLAFLKGLRDALPDDKTISIAAPASYWYLKQFPISEIADVVSYIIYMTYDLHGTWDLGDGWAQDGCPAGDCLFSHVNLTETMWSLSMITKAGVATNSVMVGVTSYGRSFQMTTAGCTDSSCTWSAAGEAGECTQTAGYISKAEINQILDDDSDAYSLFDSASDSNIVVYNETQWVGYMTTTTKSTRTSYYKTFNFAGTTEWAIDLEEFVPASIVDIISDSTDPSFDYDLPCINLIPGQNTSVELEEYLDMGISYIDRILTYDGDEGDWDSVLLQRLEDFSCDSFPDGDCGFIEPYQCGTYDNTNITQEEYWAQYIAVTFFANLKQWYSAFDGAVIEDSLKIDEIVSTFDPVTSSPFTMESFMSALSSAMSDASEFAGTFPGFSEVNAAISIATTVSSLIFNGDASLPDDSTVETEITDILSELYSSVAGYVADIDTYLFETPAEADKLPSDLTTGTYEHPVSNYLYNSRPLFTLTASQWDETMGKINVTLQKYLVGQTMGASDYYILKNGLSLNLCDDVGSYVINGSCYQLAYPGAASCRQGLSYSTNVDSDIVDSIVDYYDIEVKEMITVSEYCQNVTGEYFGAFNGDVKFSGYPVCFFNLPVLDLFKSASVAWDGVDSWDSPCLNWARNQSATEPVLGVTYLPSNLETFFDGTYCKCTSSAACKRSELGKRMVC
ncbi:hypothetical protein N7494_007963 [Penicillium frequentans]|uniref:chitinase n=1 Tax=Penicillium frequentans TaxID=3151616 RepID=A0AAD6GEP5_9EURO|nr:hypothetical protein N7494_007963 [Penicillium glabrum]